MTAVPAEANRYEIEWSFGERVRKIRAELGLEQVELGQVLGVSGPTISNWETGLRQPHDLVGVAKRLADLMAEAGKPITAAWVLGLEGQNRKLLTLIAGTSGQLSLDEELEAEGPPALVSL